MPSNRGSQAPSSFSEGVNGIVAAISSTMTAPDAGPHIAFLQQLLQAAVGQIQKGNQPQGQQQQRPPQQGMGGLMGQPPQGPSAGPSGGPSPSGASSDDIRRMVAQNAGTPS